MLAQHLLLPGGMSRVHVQAPPVRVATAATCRSANVPGRRGRVRVILAKGQVGHNCREPCLRNSIISLDAYADG